MPEELVNQLSRLSFATRGAVIASWYAIGEDGRTPYRQYLTSPRLRWTRRKRARLAAKQLLEPDDSLDGEGTNDDGVVSNNPVL